MKLRHLVLLLGCWLAQSLPGTPAADLLLHQQQCCLLWWQGRLRLWSRLLLLLLTVGSLGSVPPGGCGSRMKVQKGWSGQQSVRIA
jgi:hypothetical protein